MIPQTPSAGGSFQQTYTSAGIHISDNVADQIGFHDSVSQRKNDAYKSQDEQSIPSATELKNRPFASNLENAKLLAQLTKHRIDKLKLGPPGDQSMLDFINNTQDTQNAHLEHMKELDKQRKANKYLNDTLKHLNLSIDILIEQYDPVKLKSLKALTDRYRSPDGEPERADKAEAVAISRLLNEIKNAEKLMKNTEKELASMQKKHEKVRDWRFVARLQQKAEEDREEIERLEK